jgi:acyl carrier protein
METYERVQALIAKHAGVPLEQVTPMAELDQHLQLDSLDRIELAMRLEEEFHIQISDEEVDEDRYGRVDGLVALVTDKLEEPLVLDSRAAARGQFAARTGFDMGKDRGTPKTGL